MLIDEYLVKLGVVDDSAKAKAFRAELGNVASAATKAAGLITAAYGLITAYFAKSVGELARLGGIARETGTSVAFLQELGYAAEQSGSSVEAAQTSLVNLTRVMGEAANGVGRGAKVFEKFGLSVRNADGTMRDASDVITQIQQRMAGMEVPQQRAFLARLGIDPTMRRTLGLTADEFNGLINQAREWGVYGDEQAAVAGRLKRQFADLRFGMNQFRTLIGLALVPEMSRSIDKFKEWFRANRDSIVRGMQMAFKAIQLAIQVIKNFITWIDKMIGWRAAILLFAAAWMVLNRAMLANPVTWVIAALIGLALVIDDLMTYMEGGDSLFGAFWGPMLGYIDQIKPALIELWNAIKQLWTAIEPLAKLVSMVFGDVFTAAIEIAIAAFETLIALLANGLKGWAALARGDINGFVEAFKNGFKIINDFALKILGAIGKLIDNTLGRVGAFFGKIIGGGTGAEAVAAARNVVAETNRGVSLPAAQLERGQQYFLGTPTETSTGRAIEGIQRDVAGRRERNASTVNQDVSISIHSTDPAAAGREAARALNDEARRANVNNAPTVVQ